MSTRQPGAVRHCSWRLALVAACCTCLAAAPPHAAALQTSVVEVSRALIHVPCHTSNLGELNSFLHSAFAYTPVLPDVHAQPFDVLVVLTGGATELQKSRARGVLRGALEVYAPLAKGYVESLTLEHDIYDRKRTSADWSAGPNAEFYDVMREGGHVFDRHTRRYRYVLQMETDVCTLADGWLSRLMQPALDGTHFLVSGARLRNGTCVTDDVAAACSPVADAPAFIRGHINGNALYNMHGALQQLLNNSAAAYGTWPFDLAIWLAAQDLGWAAALHDNARFVNVQFPITGVLHQRRKQPPLATLGVAVFAHIPLKLRVSQLQAALDALDVMLPVTMTFLSSSHLTLFRNLLRSLLKQRIPNVLIVVFDDACYEAVRRLAPEHYQVVANTTTTHGSTQFKSSAFLQLVNSRQALVTDVLRSGYAILSLDVDAFVQHDYMPTLLSLPGDRTYFSSDGIGAYGYHFYNESGPRYFFNAGVFFVPRNNTRAALQLWAAWMSQIEATGEADQDLLNKLVSCTALESCYFGRSELRLGLLEPTLFQNGANFMSRCWPSTEFRERALVVHNNWADGFEVKRFRFQAARMWTSGLDVVCSNVTVLTSFGRHLNATNLQSFLAVYLAFFEHVRAAGFTCAVVPGITVAGSSTIFPFDVVFSFHKVTQLTGAQLMPDLGWSTARTNATVWNADTTGSSVPASVDDLILAQPFMEVFYWVRQALGGPYTCVEDIERSFGQIAISVLRPGGLDAVLHAAVSQRAGGHEVAFLAGSWRIFHELIDKASPHVVTSVSRRLFPPHERMVFGLPFAHANFGDGFMFDLLDLTLCKAAARRRPLSQLFPLWDVPTLLAEVARHVPPAVLHEDLQVFSRRTVDAQDVSLRRRLLFSLEDMRTSGFSNRVGSLQTLVYLAAELNASCVVPPYQPIHNNEHVAPWQQAINTSRFYDTFPHALPPSMLLLLHPEILAAHVLDGTQLPITKQPHGNASVSKHFSAAFGRIAQLHSRSLTGQSFRTLHVSPEAEQLRLAGQLAVQPQQGNIGMTDEQAADAFATLPMNSDVGMRQTFRAFHFMKGHEQHALFAQRWRRGFSPLLELLAKSDAIIAALHPPFACVHIRLSDEYLAHHAAEAHGNRTHVLLQLQQFIVTNADVQQGIKSVYVASDIDIGHWKATALPTSMQRLVHTCQDFGCPATFGENTEQGIVDANVCAAADVFRGNIFSSYSLCICAQREDQLCTDLLGRSISDDRLLL
jgi:hypothetical protein